MYYISRKVSDDTYEVVDTRDGIREVYSSSTLRDSGIEIKGVSQEGILVFDAKLDFTKQLFLNKTLQKCIIDDRTLIDYQGDVDCFTVPFYINNFESYCFKSNALKSVEILGEVSIIPQACFKFCCNLEEVILPYTVKGLAFQCFAECACLERISLPNGIEVLDDYCFCECMCLRSLVLPDSIKEIGCGCFEGCSNLVISVTSRRVEHLIRVSGFQGVVINL